MRLSNCKKKFESDLVMTNDFIDKVVAATAEEILRVMPDGPDEGNFNRFYLNKSIDNDNYSE